jgi:hypothetical protein
MDVISFLVVVWFLKVLAEDTWPSSGRSRRALPRPPTLR